MAHPTKPRPEQYATAWSFYWANRAWCKGHGRSMVVNVLIAVFFGLWSGSVVGLVLLVSFAVVATLVARSRL